jgi:hypothetical protein
MSLFVEYPALAGALGVLFLTGYWMSRQPIVAAAGVAWLVYGAYETGMRLRVLCTGECNIRVDLLLIYPLLLVISVVALLVLFRRRASGRKA